MNQQPPHLGRRELLEAASSTVKGNNTALLGPPKCGKSLLLEALKDQLTEYRTAIIPLKQVGMTPEFFALFTLNELLRAFDSGLTNPALETARLHESAEKNCPPVLEMIAGLENELQKIKPDYGKIIGFVTSAFEAADGHDGKPFLAIIDDADELLNLEHFNGLKDVWKIFMGCKSRMLISSSHVNSLTPLLNDFKLIQMELSESDASEATKGLPTEVGKSIQAIGCNHPFIINRLVTAAESEEAIVDELFNPDSSLFQFMSWWTDEALNRARGTTLPKVILQVLAREGPMRLSELARKIYRPAPVTKSVLERLIATDIITKDDKVFRFQAEPLARWYRIVTSLPELQAEPTKDNRKKLIKLMEGTA